MIALAQGDVAQAVCLLTASEAAIRRSQDTNSTCKVLHQTAFAMHMQGDARSANALMREALTLQRDSKNLLMLVESLERFAWMAADRAQWQLSATVLGAASALRTRFGAPLAQGDFPFSVPRVLALAAALDSQTLATCSAAGSELSLEAAVAYALRECGISCA